MMGIKDVAVSSGSACTSASLEPSYVLRALGVGDELAHSSIRFGLGRFNTEEEVDFVVDLVVREVNRLREMSPLYEMAQAGIDLKSIEWAAPLAHGSRLRANDYDEGATHMPYSDKILEHYNNPRNVGSFDRATPTSAPASSAPRSAATC